MDSATPSFATNWIVELLREKCSNFLKYSISFGVIPMWYKGSKCLPLDIHRNAQRTEEPMQDVE